MGVYLLAVMGAAALGGPLVGYVDENVGALTWTRAGGLYGLAWQGAASRRLVAIDPMSGRSDALGVSRSISDAMISTS